MRRMPKKPDLKKQLFISPQIFFAGIFFLGVSAAADRPSSTAGEPVPGDAIVVSSISDASNLIPFLATDATSAQISGLIFNGLVKYDENIKLTGDLAESWEIGEGGLRIVFHLRKNVRWQDGAPFTADDVKFTFEKITDPAVPTPYGADFEKVRSLTVLDPWTVEIVYKEPFSPGLASWGMGIVPKHLLEKEDLLKTEFSRKPIGTGPYRLKRWETGSLIELRANAGYFEGEPLISRYVYRIIPDPMTNFLELQTGGVDMASLSPLQHRKETDTPYFKKNYRKFQFPSFSYVYIGYNLEHPLFSDRRVRNAVGLAVDKRELIDSVLLGQGKVSTGPFLPGMWAYNPAVQETAYDPESARRLLKEAGFADTDGDGLLDRDGRAFSFTILTNQGNDQRKAVCEIVQRRLREIGIEMKIQTVEWSTFLKEFIDKKNFDAVILAWNLARDPDVYDIFHSSKTRPGEFNFVSYKNDEVDRLLDEGRRLFDERERAKAYHRIHEILSGDEPYTFLYVPDALPAVHSRFRGVKQAPIGIGHNFTRWFVPKSEQKYRFKE